MYIAFERSEDATKGSQGPLNHVFSKTEASNLFSVQDKAKNTRTRENAVDSGLFRTKYASHSDEESLPRPPCSWHSTVKQGAMQRSLSLTLQTGKNSGKRCG